MTQPTLKLNSLVLLHIAIGNNMAASIFVQDIQKITQLRDQIAELNKKMMDCKEADKASLLSEIKVLEDKIENDCNIEYKLAEMTWDILSKAISASISGNGFEAAEGGKIIFDGLYVQNAGKLEDVQKNLKLYFSLCCKAWKLVEFEKAELKKN